MGNYTVNVELRGDASDLSRDLKGVDRQLDDLNDGANRSVGGMGKLQGAAAAAGAAFAALGVASLVSELNELGQQSSATERTFVQLAGGAGAADAILNQLRESTRNTVSDMALQANANTLMSTGIATNAEDMAKLTEIAVGLGTALGNDATESMLNFNAALANSSYERLDTLGISASKVRERVQELQKSGMDMQQAFSQATIEQGTIALDRLGDTVAQNATEADKFNTKITNIKENLAEGVNFHVNMSISVLGDALTSLDQLWQIFQIQGNTHPMQEAAREQFEAAAQAWTDEYIVPISQYMGKETFNPDGTAAEWVSSLDQAFELVVRDPSLLQNKQALMEALTFVPENERDIMADAIQLSFMDKQSMAAIEQANIAYRAQQQENARKNVLAYVDSFETAVRANAGKLTSILDTINIFDKSDAQVWQERQHAIAAAADELNTFTNSYADMWPILDVNNATDVGTLDRLLQNATEELGELQALAEQGLIPDADMAKAQGIVDNLTTMKARIDDIQGMTLDGLLGKGEGDGSLSQITDMVTGDLSKSGMSEAQIAEFQRLADLASGQETESSLALEETVVPIIQQIAKTAGADAAVIAMQNVNAYLEQGKYLGMSDSDLAAGLPGATGFASTGVGANFQVNAGETPSQVAARMGMSIDEVLQATDSPNARAMRSGTYAMGGGYEAVAGFDPSTYAASMIDDTTVQAVESVRSDIEIMGQEMPGVTGQFTEVNTQVTGIQSIIADMAAKVHTVTVKLDIQGLDVLNAALTATGGGGGGGTSVQNNGGRVGQLDPRAD